MYLNIKDSQLNCKILYKKSRGNKISHRYNILQIILFEINTYTTVTHVTFLKLSFKIWFTNFSIFTKDVKIYYTLIDVKPFREIAVI